MKCRKHPKYKAIRKPTCNCVTCWKMYAEKHELTSRAKLALQRPVNYEELEFRDQWEIDKRLGILDWDGS